MSAITLDGLRKRHGTGPEVLRGVSLEIHEGEFVVIVGPSGCGKSTLLRLIAGLDPVSAGAIAIGGRIVNDLPPQDRDIAMVFQNYALYPHMTVRENIAFGLELRGIPRARRHARAEEVAQMLRLSPLLGRKPGALSGGQRQRVAMGRAIARDARVFLMDEPLSNLDAALRTELRTEIKELHRKLGATFIYVTHDQTEALSLADRIAVMREGEVLQFDTPDAIYDRPANQFVAGFLGLPPMSFVPAADLPGWQGPAGAVVGLRPEGLQIAATPPADPDAAGRCLPGRIVLSEMTGAGLTLVCDTAAGRVTATAARSAIPGRDGPVWLTWAPEAALAFDAETGARLD